MKIIISIIIVLFTLLWIGRLNITLHPFSITIPYWRMALGVLFFYIGFALLGSSTYMKGYEDGINDTTNAIQEEIDKITKKG